MRLAITFSMFCSAFALLISCNEGVGLVPTQCDCDIEGARLVQPSLVTYRVAAYDGAVVSSITYQTSNGPVTADRPPLPFSTSVQLAKGEILALRATGNPEGGSIVLTYETADDPHIPFVMSSSVSRIWISEGGICK